MNFFKSLNLHKLRKLMKLNTLQRLSKFLNFWKKSFQPIIQVRHQ